MKINIFAKNIKLTEALEEFVEMKIGTLQKYLRDKNIEARMEIGKPSKHHHSGPVFYAEGNLKVKGKLFRATCNHEDLRLAITQVKDELQMQIQKFKDKVNTSRRSKTK